MTDIEPDITGLPVAELDALAELNPDPDVEFVDAPLEDDNSDHGENTEVEMSGGE